MLAIRILIAILMAFVARLFFRPTMPLNNFPEIARGHTCVHLFNPHSGPHSPAVMTFQAQTPVFTDLYTNRSAIVYKGYTLRQIYMTSPVYRRKSVYQTLLGKPLFQIMTPTVRTILENRNKTWWSRCDRHWRELRQS